MLAAHPELGRARDEVAPGLRSFAFGRYLIFYAVEPTKVVIARILHGAQLIRPDLFRSE
jgi:toxin ParE1/3/4